MLFTLATSCLTTSNLPWNMKLTMQLPMQYCSSQHQTLLPITSTSTTGYCFCFESVSAFFLELFVHWSPGAYWAPTHLGSSSFSVLSFCLSYCSWGSQGKNAEVVYHCLLQWTTFLSELPPWPYTAWLTVKAVSFHNESSQAFIELDKAVDHVIRLGSFLWLWFSICLSGAGNV